MNKILLSAISFAVFFMFSLTGSMDGGLGVQNTGYALTIAAAVAGDDDNEHRDDRDRNNDNEDRDDHEQNNDNADRDGHERDHGDAGGHEREAGNRSAHGNSTADASCVCPPGVRSCICADGTPGSIADADADSSIVPSFLRSIFGGS